VETKGEISLPRCREQLQSFSNSALGSAAAASGLFDLKFSDAVPEPLLASEAAARAIDRRAVEIVMDQGVMTASRFTSE
jgi:hypothetical protein